MGQIEDLQNKGFGSHGGKEYTVEYDIKPLKKRVLVSDMHFGETKTKGGIIQQTTMSKPNIAESILTRVGLLASTLNLLFQTVAVQL
mgnify:CR=1 FL=1